MSQLRRAIAVCVVALAQTPRHGETLARQPTRLIGEKHGN